MESAVETKRTERKHAHTPGVLLIRRERYRAESEDGELKEQEDEQEAACVK